MSESKNNFFNVNVLEQFSRGLLILTCAFLSFRYLVRFMPQELAFGCDEFGYLLQAKLFQESSFLQALDTSIHLNPHLLLQNYLHHKIPDFDNWYNIVGPHCFHYEKLSGKTILQYPPGVGLLLSLFKSGESLQIYSIMTIGLMVFLTTTIASKTKSLIKIIFIFLVNTVVMYQILQIQVPGYSILLYTFLLSIFYLGVFSSKFNMNISYSIFIAFFIGLILAIRTPSVLVLPIFLLVANYGRPQFKFYDYIIVAIVVACIISPIAIYNTINAGHFWISTYPKYDKSLEFSNLGLILSNFEFYFLKNNLCILYAGMLVSLLYLRRKMNKLEFSVLLITVFFNIIFYLVKTVVINYYLLVISLPIIYLFLRVYAEDEEN